MLSPITDIRNHIPINTNINPSMVKTKDITSLIMLILDQMMKKVIVNVPIPLHPCLSQNLSMKSQQVQSIKVSQSLSQRRRTSSRKNEYYG